jgi:Uma2 family endonuclease
VSTGTKGLTVKTYDKMVERGILPESNRFELIRGRIVEKDVTKGRTHDNSSERSWRKIDRLLPSGWHVRIDKTVAFPDSRTELEPDISVVRGEVEDYDKRRPLPGDVALLVEISSTSVTKDRKLARIYAAANIPVYWIVNVRKRRLEVYENPVGGQYAAPRILGETDTVDLVIAGQVVGRIPVADLLPLP